MSDLLRYETRDDEIFTFWKRYNENLKKMMERIEMLEKRIELIEKADRQEAEE